ncbi:MAG: hypothetical protein IJQ80_05415, partial [Clostridia bacterium]|nr:hypothetical protein [Clostridia bacterium]
MLTGFKDRKYALIGDARVYDLPSKIHGMLADYGYSYIEADAAELKNVLSDKEYSGFNLFFRASKDILPHLSELSPMASRVGCVNTVIRRGEDLVGYNTD